MTHTYVTQNCKVMRETIGTGTTARVLDFVYDNSGKPFALRYSTNGGSSYATYYYVLNLQGDVAKLVRIYAGTTIQEYEEMASYTYNAWGEIISSSGSMADINPLRYRGYYYDTETGFYYLQSRYYDPANCRFISADTPEISAISAISISDTNLFTYCGNNPVNRADDGGQFWNTIIGAVVGAVVGAVNAVINDEDVLAGALIGAGAGALAGAAVDLAIATGGVAAVAIAAGGGAISSGANYVGTKLANGTELKDLNFGELAFEMTVGAASNLLSFGVAGGTMKKAAGSVMSNLKKISQILL